MQSLSICNLNVNISRIIIIKQFNQLVFLVPTSNRLIDIPTLDDRPLAVLVSSSTCWAEQDNRFKSPGSPGVFQPPLVHLLLPALGGALLPGVEVADNPRVLQLGQGLHLSHHLLAGQLSEWHKNWMLGSQMFRISRHNASEDCLLDLLCLLLLVTDLSHCWLNALFQEQNLESAFFSQS